MNDIYEGEFNTDVLWDFDYTDYEDTETIVLYSVEPAEPWVGLMHDGYDYQVLLYRNNELLKDITDELSDVDNLAIYNACVTNFKEIENSQYEPF